jgi:hypothetical protein
VFRGEVRGGLLKAAASATSASQSSSTRIENAKTTLSDASVRRRIRLQVPKIFVLASHMCRFEVELLLLTLSRLTRILPPRLTPKPPIPAPSRPDLAGKMAGIFPILPAIFPIPIGPSGIGKLFWIMSARERNLTLLFEHHDSELSNGRLPHAAIAVLGRQASNAASLGLPFRGQACHVG